MCAVRVVSLFLGADQTIPNDGSYHIVKFPFTGESYDVWGMHQPEQPVGNPVTNWETDERSGLIWPSKAGWGSLTAMVYWEPGAAGEVRDRFVRDPLNLTTGYDSTATEDHADTPGGEYIHKCHELFVDPNVPLGFLVKCSSSSPRKITHAQFKLAIHPVEEP